MCSIWSRDQISFSFFSLMNPHLFQRSLYSVSVFMQCSQPLGCWGSVFCSLPSHPNYCDFLSNDLGTWLCRTLAPSSHCHFSLDFLIVLDLFFLTVSLACQLPGKVLWELLTYTEFINKLVGDRISFLFRKQVSVSSDLGYLSVNIVIFSQKIFVLLGQIYSWSISFYSPDRWCILNRHFLILHCWRIQCNYFGYSSCIQALSDFILTHFRFSRICWLDSHHI